MPDFDLQLWSLKQFIFLSLRLLRVHRVSVSLGQVWLCQARVPSALLGNQSPDFVARGFATCMASNSIRERFFFSFLFLV